MALECTSEVNLDVSDRPSQQLKIRRLRSALFLLVGLSVAEMMISHRGQNLSLLADAGHVASDAAAIAFTLLAVWLGHFFQFDRANAHQQKRIYRLEALVALVNGVSLLVISCNVILTAIARLQSHSVADHYNAMVLAAAIASFIINGCNVLWLKGCSHHDLSLKSALLHVLADMIGASGVMLGIVVENYFDVVNADAIASLITSTIIASASVPLLMQSLTSLSDASEPNLCLCHTEKPDLEKVLFPSLEQLVL